MEFGVLVIFVNMDIGVCLFFLDPFIKYFLLFFAFQPVFKADPVIVQVSRVGRIVSLDFDYLIFFACTGLIQERGGNFTHFQFVYLTGHFSFDGFSGEFGISVFLVENQSAVVSGLFVHGEISCGFFKRGFPVVDVSQHGVQMLDCFLPANKRSTR